MIHVRQQTWQEAWDKKRTHVKQKGMLPASSRNLIALVTRDLVDASPKAINNCRITSL